MTLGTHSLPSIESEADEDALLHCQLIKGS